MVTIANILNMEDLRIYLISLYVLVLNLGDIENITTLVLTIVVIGYSLTKWYYLVKEKRTLKDCKKKD